MYRILIADDEMIECRGLEMMIGKLFPEAELLASAYNGVELLKKAEECRPDIIVADINMPGLGGLEAIEILRMKSNRTKVVINTAYSDFALVKKAMVLGASDYLLKPIDAEDLKKTLGKVMEELGKERMEIETARICRQRLQGMEEIAGEEILSSIILGNPNERGFQIWMDNFGRKYSGGVIAALSPRQNTCREAYLWRLSKVLAEMLKSYCPCICKVHRGILYLYFLPEGLMEEENYEYWIKTLLGKLLEKIEKEYGVRLCAGVGRWNREFRYIEESLRESVTALSRTGDGEIVFFREKSRIFREKRGEGIEKELRELVLSKRWEESENLLRKFFEQLEKSGVLREEIQTQAVFLVWKLGREQGMDEKAELSWQKITSKLKDVPKDNFVKTVVAFFHESCSFPDTDERGVYVRTAVSYLKKNYSRDLSLEETAGQVGISPFYLSRLIKQQSGLSFVELLTEIRVNEAIKLILEEETAIKDIGSQVGYQSPTYFYKVFKRYTGMTVGEMRRRIET